MLSGDVVNLDDESPNTSVFKRHKLVETPREEEIGFTTPSPEKVIENFTQMFEDDFSDSYYYNDDENPIQELKDQIERQEKRIQLLEKAVSHLTKLHVRRRQK